MIVIGSQVTGTHPVFDWTASGVLESVHRGQAVVRLAPGAGFVVLPVGVLVPS